MEGKGGERPGEAGRGGAGRGDAREKDLVAISSAKCLLSSQKPSLV